MGNVSGGQVIPPPLFLLGFIFMEYLASGEYQINNVHVFLTLDMSGKLGFWRYCPNLRVFPESYWVDLLVASYTGLGIT